MLFDQWSFRWAPKVTLGLAMLCSFVSFFDDQALSPATVVITDLLVFWLWLRFVAWLGSLTDDTGAWRSSLLWEDIKGRIGAAYDELKELGEEKALGILLILSAYAARLGMFAILGSNWLRIVDVARTLGTEKAGLAPVWEPLRSGGSVLIGLGLLGLVILAIVLWREGPRAAYKRADLGHLPAYLDLNEQTAIDSADPLIREVLLVLQKWSPTLDYGNERRHQEALLRRLRRQFGRAVVEEEYLIGRRRADVAIGGVLLLELKVKLTGANERNRAITQVQDYARLTGLPLLFVLFKTPDLSDNAMHWVKRMHRDFPIVTVRMPYLAAE